MRILAAGSFSSCSLWSTAAQLIISSSLTLVGYFSSSLEEYGNCSVVGMKMDCVAEDVKKEEKFVSSLMK